MLALNQFSNPLNASKEKPIRKLQSQHPHLRVLFTPILVTYINTIKNTPSRIHAAAEEIRKQGVSRAEAKPNIECCEIRSEAENRAQQEQERSQRQGAARAEGEWALHEQIKDYMV